MRTLEVQKYKIYFGSGILDDIGVVLGNYTGRRAAVITDSNVEPLYGARVAAALRKAGIEPLVYVVPAGEASKCHAQLLGLYDKMWADKLSRRDVIIALGGGVVGDLAGFAASTYLRGIDYVQVPTTLLAQVDSSVGGKVAVDLPQGKNLVGAFYLPQAVLADSSVLATLDARQQACGMAEIIKYGCIREAELFQRLAGYAALDAVQPDLEQIVALCCAIKRDYVEADPEDRGLRAELNFGHTLGHALEQTIGYGTLLHGEGVACGMVWAARVGERLGITPSGTAEQIASLVRKMGLPDQYSLQPENIEPVWQAMCGDKKGTGGAVNLVLLERIGRATLRKTSFEELREFLTV